MRSFYWLPVLLIALVVVVVGTIVMLPPPEGKTPGVDLDVITDETLSQEGDRSEEGEDSTSSQGMEGVGEDRDEETRASEDQIQEVTKESPTDEAGPASATSSIHHGSSPQEAEGIASATGGEEATQTQGDLPLEEAIAGKVEDTKGFALYNVKVEVSGYDEVMTKNDGRFRIDGIEEESVTVVASREGYHTLKKSDVKVGTDSLTLTLVPEGVLAGRVVDQRNEPVSSAMVSLNALEGIWLTDLYAGPDGRFQVSEIPNSPMEIKASQDDFSDEGEGTRVVEPPFDEEVVLRLHQPTFSISGQVVMKEEGSGVPGFSLQARLQDREGEVEPMITSTGGGGVFRFDDLVRGTYLISSNAQENADMNVVIPVDEDNKSVRVHESDVRNIQFEAVEGRRIRGRVVDQGGQPVSGAEVSVVQYRSTKTMTNRDGNFTLEGGPVLSEIAPRDMRLQLYATHPEHGMGMSDPLPSQSEEGVIEGIEITLAGTSTLQGRVVTADGDGVSEARVMLQDLLRGAIEETVTDGSGSFMFDELSASERTMGAFRGTHQLLVQKEGYADSQQEIVVKPGEAQNITVTMHGGSVIEGNITDSNDKPLQGVQVKAMDVRGVAGTVVSDEYGHYQFSHLRDGQYDLLYRLETNPPMTGARYQVSTGSQNVDVTLIPGEWILMGTVYNAENEQYLTNYQVTVQGRPDSAQGRMFVKNETFNTPDGTYRLRLTEPGRYTLTISAEGYHPGEYPQRIGPDTQTTQIQNAYLEPLSNTGTIQGILNLPDDMQLVGVEVLGITSVPTSGNEFMIEDIPAGEHNLLFIVRTEEFQAGEPIGVYPSVRVEPEQTTNLRQIALQQLQRTMYRGF